MRDFLTEESKDISIGLKKLGFRRVADIKYEKKYSDRGSCFVSVSKSDNEKYYFYTNVWHNESGQITNNIFGFYYYTFEELNFILKRVLINLT